MIEISENEMFFSQLTFAFLENKSWKQNDKITSDMNIESAKKSKQVEQSPSILNWMEVFVEMMRSCT